MHGVHEYACKHKQAALESTFGGIKTVRCEWVWSAAVQLIWRQNGEEGIQIGLGELNITHFVYYTTVGPLGKLGRHPV